MGQSDLMPREDFARLARRMTLLLGAKDRVDPLVE
jgi:hypothetical protein